MKAEPHPLQSERLRTLHRYDILDTPRDEDFDEIVALASRICEAPISVVNLIDEHRQWFKAEVGLGVRETPLETSICSHVILGEDFVEIPDTLADPRMADNPLCLGDAGLRFYAGARLLADNGLPIGTLCVLDRQPRTLTDLQRQTLIVLARQVMRQLDLRLALRNQEILRGEMDHRVKNSLQTVAALIRLYRNQVADGPAAAAFEAIQRHVEAIGTLHHEMHETSHLEQVRLDRFLGRVVSLLRQSAPQRIGIKVDVDQLHVGSTQATAVAVIVSEFVANSIKHGFPDQRQGEISITGRGAGDRVEIVCRDNGVGSQGAKRAPDGVESLGTRLLEASASQIGAELERTATRQGYRLRLGFNLAN